MINWINIILIIFGIAMMVYSTYISIKVYRIFSSDVWFSFGGKLKKTWKILPLFIIFFLTGYCFYLILYLKKSSVNYEILTALIFFFGALFVLVVVFTHYKVFIMIRGKKRGGHK